MLILKPDEVRVMAAVLTRGVVPDRDQLKILERALRRIASEDEMLAAMAKAAAPAEPPPKVPA